NTGKRVADRSLAARGLTPSPRAPARGSAAPSGSVVVGRVVRVDPPVGLAALQVEGLLLHHRGGFVLPGAGDVPVAERVSDLVVDQIDPVGLQIVVEVVDTAHPTVLVDDGAVALRTGDVAVGTQRRTQFVHRVGCGEQDPDVGVLGIHTLQGSFTIVAPTTGISENRLDGLDEVLVLAGQAVLDLDGEGQQGTVPHDLALTGDGGEFTVGAVDLLLDRAQQDVVLVLLLGLLLLGRGGLGAHRRGVVGGGG